MSIRAIAYHESVALEKLEVYFKSEGEEPYAGSTAAKCPNCNLAFAVVLTLKSDPLNPEYIQELVIVISGDCSDGVHKEEYVVERGNE